MKKLPITMEMDRARSSVAEILGWCLAIALNQEMGIGAKRLERCAEASAQIQEQYIETIDCKGLRYAMEEMQKEMADLCDTEFRVPMRRAARNRREQQLRIAGDQGATVAWCVWARAAHEVLGFGPKRLDKLRKATDANYRQFADWEAEDQRWAWENLRRCAEAALGESIDIVDTPDDNPNYASVLQEDPDLTRRCMQRIGRAKRPAGWAVFNQDELITQIEEIKKAVVNSLVRA